MQVPESPKIYHIVHVDKLSSIVADDCLYSDAMLAERPPVGTVIGMQTIKTRRLGLRLTSHQNLFVGDCVPLYFCPRSVMLYLIHKQNAELTYKDGQSKIVHLVADLKAVVAWANANKLHWAFTLSNAGAYYFEDRANLAQLHEINWGSISANQWSASGIKEEKQAEFLIEQQLTRHLIESIGVHNKQVGGNVMRAVTHSAHKPIPKVESTWYY
jgi:ssDNA thymidine ADP-ribosyltransferase, DarT